MFDPVTIKGVILLIVALVGGFAIWMGYDLFRRGIDRASSAEASGKGWKIHFVDVGPGVFFLTGGTVALVFAATHELHSQTYHGPAAPVATNAAPASAVPTAEATASSPDIATAAPASPARSGPKRPSPSHAVTPPQLTIAPPATAPPVEDSVIQWGSLPHHSSDRCDPRMASNCPA